MNTRVMRIVVASLFGVALFVTPASAKERFVDCDEGQSIQEQLDKAPSATIERLEIYVSGTCEERVIIRRDAVTIDGDAIIIGDIRVFQASDVWLYDLTVTGPYGGVTVAGSNSLRLTGVSLVGNDENGLSVRSRGLAWLRFGTTISENGGSGIYVEDGSVRIDDASITNNQGNGIETMIGNVIASRSALIGGNMGHGIDGNFHSSVLLRGWANVSGNGASGVRLDHDSGLLTFDGASIWGNTGGLDVACGDTESSAEFFGAIPDNVECTGFDQVESQGLIPAVTFESGSATYPAGTERLGDGDTFISDTADPLGPFYGRSVHFRGVQSGGVPLVYRYRIDFDHDVQLDSIVVSGAAWFGMIRVLDENQNELVGLNVPPPPQGSNGFQDVVLNTPGVTGRTFYLEEFNNDTDWRFRSNIALNVF